MFQVILAYRCQTEDMLGWISSNNSEPTGSTRAPVPLMTAVNAHSCPWVLQRGAVVTWCSGLLSLLPFPLVPIVEDIKEWPWSGSVYEYIQYIYIHSSLHLLIPTSEFTSSPLPASWWFVLYVCESVSFS